jgi:carbon storage regulator
MHEDQVGMLDLGEMQPPRRLIRYGMLERKFPAMLVLTRKTDEEIQIGSDVTVRVLSIGRGRIRIGIEAPADLRVRRAEVAPGTSAATASVDADAPFGAKSVELRTA